MKRWIFLVALGAAGALALRIYVIEGVYIATASVKGRLIIF